MFLRSRKFNCHEAAESLVQHFHVKRTLFGDGDVLSRDVHQSDLGPKDKLLLETGFLQVMPERDAAGRTILLIVCSNVEKFPKDGWEIESEIRLTWYVAMAVQRDEESQKKGIVCMIMNFSSFKVSMDIYEAVNNLDLVLPHRIVGAHYCYTDPAMRPYVAGFQLLLHEKDRYRMRTHFGPRHEIDFELQTFGIPTKSCPISKDGTCCNQWHDQWLAMLRRQEEQDDDTDEDILVPRRFDVLLGKHSEAREHTGTLRALHVVEMYFEQYEKLGKYQKTEVAEKIISIIHESGGRFLKQSQYRSWNEVEDTEARKKIGHWFRHARAKRIRHPNTIPYTKEIPTPTNDWTANCPLKSATSAISACVPPIDEQH